MNVIDNRHEEINCWLMNRDSCVLIYSMLYIISLWHWFSVLLGDKQWSTPCPVLCSVQHSARSVRTVLVILGERRCLSAAHASKRAKVLTYWEPTRVIQCRYKRSLAQSEFQNGGGPSEELMVKRWGSEGLGKKMSSSVWCILSLWDWQTAVYSLV